MKGTVIYHAPVGDLQVDWEDGAITALKRAGADVKEAGAPNGLTEQVFRQRTAGGYTCPIPPDAVPAPLEL